MSFDGRRLLYFECASGISGDMAVAAMLDLGIDADVLLRTIDGMGLECSVRITDVVKSGLRAKDFDVILEEDNHDHDMEYLYGEDHHHCHHHHSHRSYRDIVSIIERADLSDRAREVSLRVFRILGEAEAEAHGVPLEEVHFHEVGAVDSIVDIVSMAVCLDLLDVDGVCFSDLYEGTGTVRCQHGILPVPVPAVTSIVSTYGIPLCITSSKGEYVTPTGAAFAAAVRTMDRPGSFRIMKVGMGAGKRESERSGILRAMIIESEDIDESLVKLECNIDDSTGEELGFTMERLFAAGARDVSYSPLFMKKNRPAWLLTVICDEDVRSGLELIIFRETTTIGIRRCRVERTVLGRTFTVVSTVYGDVSVKVCELEGIRRFYPEYEDVARICRDLSVPYREVYDAAVDACRRQ